MAHIALADTTSGRSVAIPGVWCFFHVINITLYIIHNEYYVLSFDNRSYHMFSVLRL